MLLGRYRSQYDQLRSIGRNDTDLAIAQFGRAQVSCWTSPRHRTWGTHEQRQAAIMGFHLEANPGCEDGVLRSFEVELKFTNFALDTASSEAHPERIAAQQEESSCDEREVCLIGCPAPRCVQEKGEWTFSSYRLPDEQSGQALAARWTWESTVAHELRERILHGGVALYHPGQPFQVVCHVKGRVTKPRNIILKFSDQHHKPRSWKVTPQVCEQDLQADINALESRMKRLNTRSASTIQVETSAAAPASTSDPTQLARMMTGAPTYGDSTIGGTAQVQIGNNYYYRVPDGEMPAVHGRATQPSNHSQQSLT